MKNVKNKLKISSDLKKMLTNIRIWNVSHLHNTDRNHIYRARKNRRIILKTWDFRNELKDAVLRRQTSTVEWQDCLRQDKTR